MEEKTHIIGGNGLQFYWKKSRRTILGRLRPKTKHTTDYDLHGVAEEPEPTLGSALHGWKKFRLVWQVEERPISLRGWDNPQAQEPARGTALTVEERAICNAGETWRALRSLSPERKDKLLSALCVLM